MSTSTTEELALPLIVLSSSRAPQFVTRLQDSWTICTAHVTLLQKVSNYYGNKTREVASPWEHRGCSWCSGPGRAEPWPGRPWSYSWGPAAPGWSSVSEPDPMTPPLFGLNRSAKPGAASASSWPEENTKQLWEETARRWGSALKCRVTFRPALRAAAPPRRRLFQLRFRTSIPMLLPVRKAKQIQEFELEHFVSGQGF